ncbi:mucin-5AC isoform X2 [Archocentrus centrarchus]|uniref:mucin-5AC isoform X2 n=1 Tax=Archocentrus centrarchus TaxID=63155 RepID=UPI0011E9E867|nr:mucin-5AC-like isoform X2 [Archocentrus centrarchus]
MQLHACLLLFVITTDKTLAFSYHHCGGNVSLGEETAGRINLTLPGLFTNSSRLNPVNQEPDKRLQLSACTWVIDIPLGRQVLLKLAWLESGSSLSVRCVWNEEDEALVSGGMALLSGCDRNKATLSWTGPGHSLDAVHLAYYVQENERNSSEDHSTHHPDRDPTRWSPTGTSFTNTAPVGQERTMGTEEGRGRVYNSLEWSSAPPSVSSASSQDQRLLNPTSPMQGLPVAGRTDRETLPLPEEKPNNGPEKSGAAHRTDAPMTARETTHTYFQNALSTNPNSNTPPNPTEKGLHTQMALTDASSSNALFGTDVQEHTSVQTSKNTNKDVTTQMDQSVSSSSVPFLTSSPPELPSSWTGHTVITAHGGVVSGTSGHKDSWRSPRSTDTHDSELTFSITSDPLKSSIKPLQDDLISAQTHTEPTSSSSSSSSSEVPTRTHSSNTYITELDGAVGTVEADPVHPNISQSNSFVTVASDVTAQTVTSELPDKFEHTEVMFPSSTQSQTDSPQSTESPTHSIYISSSFTQTDKETQTAVESTQRNFIYTHMTGNTTPSSPGTTKAYGWTSGFTVFSSKPRAALTMGGVTENSAITGTTGATYALYPTHTLLHDNSPTDSPTTVPLSSSATSTDSSTPSYTRQTHSMFVDSSQPTLTTSVSQSTVHTVFFKSKTTPSPPQMSPHTLSHLPLPTSTNILPTRKHFQSIITTTHTPLPSTKTSDDEVKVEEEDRFWQWFPSSTTPPWSSTNSPKFFIVPDQPAAIKVESVELLLQIVVEEPVLALNVDLENDTTAWVKPYLQRAPGFSRLLGVWSSGRAVQSLVEFKTSRALEWLSMTEPTSLLERTGLAQAVRNKRTFRTSKITNITVGGLQGDICDWLLQCPAGYKCVSQPGTTNYSCSSVCHFDYCHHHGICTHHPAQLPVCRCLAGDDFWFMGQRCDMRMTRARLVGACLAILLIMVTVIGILAFVAVRRYRAILIQAKVDQTRSSYRRFNHFDELSGRFWLRSWAGSADSLDNPAFTRSDELLHLRALDRPCCYHDDTLSLASTCPSHGTRINTIYPHSSQYGWRGSEMSMGDGVLDSGKASDLSVCSWPVEPIHWTPFPLLQQLASHRTPTVRVSRPRSYCEGMELVDMGKSWTA